MTQTVGVGLLLLSGCEVARSARDDLARLTSSQPAASSQVRKTTSSQTAARRTPQSSATEPSPPIDGPTVEATAAPPKEAPAPAVNLVGAGESKLRAQLGAPTSEEDHPPGKRWQYRNGKCTLDIQLYPDVQTKQLGTLAYKVKSDDNTDEGRRLCLAQLQSRLQARR